MGISRDKLINFEDIQEEMELIEGSKDYYISSAGKVYRKYPDGYLWKKPFKNSKGYDYVHIFFPDSSRHSFSVHRLVATAFIPNPDNLPIIGHKDNIKTHNDISNLYWTTYSENTQKAVEDNLLIGKKGSESSSSRAILVFDKEWNKVGEYACINECSQALGIHKSTISRHCNSQKDTPSCGYYFRFKKRPKAQKKSGTRPVVVYDKDWKEIGRYDSITSCSKVFEIDANTISRHCNGHLTKSKGGYHFQFQEEIHGKYASRPVIAYDEEWNEVGRYDSVQQCCRSLNVAKCTVIRHCKGQRKNPLCGYHFRYQEDASSIEKEQEKLKVS